MSTDRTEGINHNIYALLCEKPQHIVKVTNKINTILRKAVEDLNKLNKKYPDAGIGDTATYECITSQFYSILH
mgnify:FL=1|tara:strand:+ start:4440 stop:4658 length:219 start_codon:yes stop_codon:yes gene_type:complete